MKYGKVTLGQIETILNKITAVDGEDAVDLLLRGELVIAPKPHYIPAGPDLLTPIGAWKIKSHLETPTLEWHAMLERITYVSWAAAGTDRKKYTRAGSGGVGVHVLQYLLEHQHLIPESWKRWRVFFTGTVFATPSGGGEAVAFLEYRDIDEGDYRWHWDIATLNGGKWFGNTDFILLYHA